MIGAGIFVLPGPASDVAGPAVALSFVIGRIISLFTAMSASELGTAMPKAGGSYYFVNPEHESHLISLASAMAKQHDNGTVVAVHIVKVPGPTPLELGAAHIDDLDAESGTLLAAAQRDAETLGVDVETHTILSHRVYDEIFDVDTSVIIAEKARDRSLKERLFGGTAPSDSTSGA